MKGADKYYDLFEGKSQQIGRLWLRCHTHARGKCFEILLLPKGVNYDVNTRTDAVEVYGMTSGQRGWTETYGWLHDGKWQDDFYAIVTKKEAEKKAAEEKRKQLLQVGKEQAKSRTAKLLSDY